jgi:valyl-tRNA synthetase
MTASTTPASTPGEGKSFPQLEAETYDRWERAGVFVAHPERVDPNAGRPAFVITMPPPNVTAVLHMGHGLNNTVQDVIIRWRRMCGDEALWVPGTDHAGIATQNVVEKLIAKEGLTRFDIGRDAFVRRTTEFVRETGGTILSQLRAIGASADWTRTAYTLTPQLSRAVREAFVRLYERGLIYRGHRVIHWCVRCLTSLSDEEAEHVEEDGKLYHIRYRVVVDGAGKPGADRYLTVATTRPETMLGDVAVAVNPADERYSGLVGGRVLLPIADLEIPIIADEYVDPAFGTGVVKVTPAHDPNDFEAGVRHSLPSPVVMTAEGRMNEVADARGRVPRYLRGVDRFEARDVIVDRLRDEGSLARVENHRHAVRHCYRCDTVVEPRLSDQWFVRMEPLARPALRGVREGEIRILPERHEAVYMNWLENIRDWNISRQLWWGHRVPVWYCDSCARQIVSREDVATCPGCGGAVRQDEDVLDTWFSSWLWPISTLGWPDENHPDLRAFYPTDMLITAPEILFFWVARMIFAGYEFTGKAPFHTVYLHGTVRDTQHVKMSKSLGNGIDPLDVVNLFGADALRFTVIAGMGMGADLILDPKDLEKSFAPGRNFVTKLQNIGRFILGNVGDQVVLPLHGIPDDRLTRADKWILERLNSVIDECDAALGPARPTGSKWEMGQLRLGLRLNEYAESARRFVWNDLADWYLESTKGRMAAAGPDRDVARAVLVHSFGAALRLLQPIVPFVTDQLWQKLPLPGGGDDSPALALAAWPIRRVVPPGGEEFELVRDVVIALRQARADYAVPPSATVAAFINTVRDRNPERAAEVFRGEGPLISRLVRSSVHVNDSSSAAGVAAAAHSLLASGTELVVPLGDVVDVAKECRRLRGELEELEKQLNSLRARLSNEGFVSRAPAHVVDGERAKELDWTKRRDQLAEKVKGLCGA